MSQNIKNCVVDLGERHAGVLCTVLATFQLLRICNLRRFIDVRNENGHWIYYFVWLSGLEWLYC